MMDKLLYLYLAAINAAAFVMMGADKRRARRGRWRISEKALFAAALAGGSAGAVLGMQIFRHKTRHWYCVGDARDSCLAAGAFLPLCGVKPGIDPLSHIFCKPERGAGFV